MGWQVWLYHPDHPARIFDSDEVEERLKEGWADAPDPDWEEPRPAKRPKAGKVGSLGGTASGTSSSE